MIKEIRRVLFHYNIFYTSQSWRNIDKKNVASEIIFLTLLILFLFMLF